MSQCHLGSNINSLIKRMARALILPALTLLTTTILNCISCFLTKAKVGRLALVAPLSCLYSMEDNDSAKLRRKSKASLSSNGSLLWYLSHHAATTRRRPNASELWLPSFLICTPSALILGGQASGPATSICATLRICDTSDWKILCS